MIGASRSNSHGIKHFIVSPSINTKAIDLKLTKLDVGLSVGLYIYFRVLIINYITQLLIRAKNANIFTGLYWLY
jgi:hypothetical protein